MSDFSNKLKYYLERSNYSITSFAKSCEIDRTLLHKYTTGTRIPKNSKFIDLISDKLLLSVTERDEIYRLWKMESIGPNLFLQREKIKNLLENFSIYNNFSIPETTTNTFDINNIPEFKISSNQQELIMLLRSILTFESKKETFPVSIYMQPRHPEIAALLSEFSLKQNLSITHLICFHQHRDSFIHNISLIENVLNLSFCIANYNVKVYYEDASQHINQMSLLPNLIITDEFVLVSSYDLSNGIVYHKSEVHDFYQTIFDKMSSSCKQISRNCTTSSEYHRYFFDSTFHYGLTQSPQLGLVVEKEVYEDVISDQLDNREEFIQLALESSKRLKTEYNKKIYNFYFTDNGLANFIESGRNTEFPSVLYRPLTKKESLDCIHLYCENTAGKYLKNNMLNNKFFNYTSDIIVYVEIGKKVVFQKPVKDNFPKIISIEETSFSEMILDFFENMEEMEYSHSFDDSTQYIKDSLEHS